MKNIAFSKIFVMSVNDSKLNTQCKKKNSQISYTLVHFFISVYR
jgi:hypothetical protein